MNVLFVYPNVHLLPQINHGIVALAAALKEKGHRVNLLHLTTPGTEGILKTVSDFNPGIICFSLTENQWPYAEMAAKQVKKHFSTKVFMGGPLPSAYPEIINESESFDGICLGEADLSLIELIDNIENGNYESTKGFWFRHEKDIIRNGFSDIIADLDTLAFPDYSIFDVKAVLNYPAFSFSRGCPFDCTYCCAPKFRSIYGQNKIRFKSIARVMDEIGALVKKYNPSHLIFDDDTFMKSRQWFGDFCAEYPRRFKLPFYCNTRPELVTPEACAKLKDAGCRCLSIGIESGSLRVRKEILNRHLTEAQIIDAFRFARDSGLETASFNMVGIPGETPVDFQDTIRVNQRILPDVAQISIFYPYRGTRLGDLCYANGYVGKKSQSTIFSRSILSLPFFPRRKIEGAALFFNYEIYKKSDLMRSFRELFRSYLKRLPSIFNLLRTCKRIIRQF